MVRSRWRINSSGFNWLNWFCCMFFVVVDLRKNSPFPTVEVLDVVVAREERRRGVGGGGFQWGSRVGRWWWRRQVTLIEARGKREERKCVCNFRWPLHGVWLYGPKCKIYSVLSKLTGEFTETHTMKFPCECKWNKVKGKVNANQTKWRKNNIIIQQNKAAEREDIRWLDMRTRKQDAQTHHLYGVSNILDVWNHNEKLAQCVHWFVFLKA